MESKNKKIVINIFPQDMDAGALVLILLLFGIFLVFVSAMYFDSQVKIAEIQANASANHNSSNK